MWHRRGPIWWFPCGRGGLRIGGRRCPLLYGASARACETVVSHSEGRRNLCPRARITMSTIAYVQSNSPHAMKKVSFEFLLEYS